jgi:type IV pilus assembly protein PilO
MTLADDFISEDGSDLAADYPSAFGITFTPIVSGIALAVLGIVGAGYIFMNMVKPALESYEQVKSQQQEKQNQINRLKSGDIQQQIATLNGELQAEQQLKSRILSLFTNEKDLNTLLLDLSSFITANQGKLINYTPESSPVIIQDGSLGNEVNGKLKKTSIALEIEATFPQTQAILRDLERLQPLLVVQSYSSKVSQPPAAVLSVSTGELVPSKEAKLQTQLKLDAILPLSPQEQEQAEQQQEQNQEEQSES